MLTEKTVLILGAGASNVYGLPLGVQLLQDIKSACSSIRGGNHDIIANTGYSIKAFEPLLKVMENSTFRSIDALLAVNGELAPLGKYMITAILARLESKTAFGKVPHEKNWMHYLFERMAEGAALDRFQQNHVTFVTFNYDRTVEYYLREFLKERYRVDDQKAHEIASKFPVIHLHGQMGSLADLPFGETNFKFGAGHIKRAAEGIKVLFEAGNESKEFLDAKEAIRRAGRVGIMGFGFHRENVARLKLAQTLLRKHIYATRLGITNPELKWFTNIIERHAGKDFDLIDGDCLTLLRETVLLHN
jgi:hypothetical protein